MAWAKSWDYGGRCKYKFAWE